MLLLRACPEQVQGNRLPRGNSEARLAQGELLHLTPKRDRQIATTRRLTDNQGARYLGVHDVGNITCNTWTKADFVVYYSDQHTGHPVRWTFLKDNMTQDVVRFHEGREAPEETWEVPRYCVNKSVALRKR